VLFLTTSSFFITRWDPRVIWRNRNYQKNSGSYPVGDRNPAGTALGRSFTNRKCTIFPPTSIIGGAIPPTIPPPPFTHPFQQAVSPIPSRTRTSWVSHDSLSPSHSTSRSTFPYSNHRIRHRESPGRQWMPIPPPFFLGNPSPHHGTRGNLKRARITRAFSNRSANWLDRSKTWCHRDREKLMLINLRSLTQNAHLNLTFAAVPEEEKKRRRKRALHWWGSRDLPYLAGWNIDMSLVSSCLSLRWGVIGWTIIPSLYLQASSMRGGGGC